jgi:hypothetical protein
LDNYNRRSNLIIDGLAEREGELTTDLVNQVIHTFMNMGVSNPRAMNFDRIYRLNYPRGQNLRPVLIKFANQTDRDTVWSARRKLKGSKIFVREDYCPETSKHRASLLPIMKAARDEKMKVYLKGDTLVVNGKQYGKNDLALLPPSINPKVVSTKIDGDSYAFFGKNIELSNFYPSTFTIDGIIYNSGEQYFQYQKSIYFNDHIMADKIIHEIDPSRQKMLARSIRGFDDNKWIEVCEDIMHKGLMAKFSQNPDLLEALESTGHRYILEASPKDKFWGTGVSLANSACLNRSKHTGLNRLGKILENVRENLCHKDS